MSSLEIAVAKANQKIRRKRRALWLIPVMQSFLAGGLGLIMWTLLSPTDTTGPIIIAFVLMMIPFLWYSPPRLFPVDEKSYLLHLEITFPTLSQEEAIAQEDIRLRKWLKAIFLSHASTLLIPSLTLIAAITIAPISIERSIGSINQVASILTKEISLTIVHGGDKPQETFTLSTDQPIQKELQTTNMVSLNIIGTPVAKPPTILLKPMGDKKDQSPEQTFQLEPRKDHSSGLTSYGLMFSISQSSALLIPELSGDKPFAIFTIKEIPLPIVTLNAITPIEEIMPDDQPLELQITAESENPLAVIEIMVKSGEKIAPKELVLNVMKDDTLNIDTHYTLILENYVDEEEKDLEIIALAQDRSYPTPLIGESKPLIIKAASAYGRYRQTLRTLGELKQLIDKALQDEESSKELEQSGEQTLQKAGEQAQKSPFFDSLDRAQLAQFQEMYQLWKDQGKPNPPLYQLSEQLNQFLYEHELLDDKERDRDFFVAARHLSRHLETKEQATAAKQMIKKMESFLDERHKRWESRIGYMTKESQEKIVEWPKVRDQKPFHQSLKKIESANSHEESSRHLSEMVNQYKDFIDSLEKVETKDRDEQEKQKQEGIASARDQLKELQKRQAQVSSALDQAKQKAQSDLKREWPSTKSKQISNKDDANKLEAQLRALSPGASDRMKAAINAMEEAINSGEGEQFERAESAADFAGRLLRQADDAASQSQKQKSQRGRRKRVSGDNYHGDNISGQMEIKREYEVNRRYREDVLDEVEHAAEKERYQKLLDHYLRQIIR